jgi:hypothetical protein
MTQDKPAQGQNRTICAWRPTTYSTIADRAESALGSLAFWNVGCAMWSSLTAVAARTRLIGRPLGAGGSC